MRLPALLPLTFAAVLAPGAAAATGCALQLVLAVDVSGSIDTEEWRLQSEGMSAAFEDPAVVEAIEALPGALLVTQTQWSGVAQQRQATGWHIVADAASAHAFAEAMRQTGRTWSRFSTAIGEALRHAGAIGRAAPMSCARRVIDVTGDGYSNEGPFPGQIADALAAEGYQINGLVIRGSEPDPAPFFELEVIAGKDAFVEIAADFADFPRAFRRKLLREIGSDLVVGQAR